MTDRSQGWMVEDDKGVQEHMANHSRQLEISGDEVAIEKYERGNSYCVPFREDTSYPSIHRDSRRRLWHADTRSSRDQTNG
jgi:hypothetical protein